MALTAMLRPATPTYWNGYAADLFAILKTTEKLERAWTRDLISAKEYEPLCAKLIAQFKTLWSTLRDSVQLSLCILFCHSHHGAAGQSPNSDFSASTCMAELAPRQLQEAVLNHTARYTQVPNVGEFMRQHSMQCPMALQRLVVVGLPATVEHGE